MCCAGIRSSRRHVFRPRKMERSPLITALFHARIVSILLILGALDLLFVHRAWVSLTTRGPSVDIVFGLEVGRNLRLRVTWSLNVFISSSHYVPLPLLLFLRCLTSQLHPLFNTHTHTHHISPNRCPPLSLHSPRGWLQVCNHVHSGHERLLEVHPPHH